MIKHFGKLYGKDLLTFKWNDELFLNSRNERERKHKHDNFSINFIGNKSAITVFLPHRDLLFD